MIQYIVCYRFSFFLKKSKALLLLLLCWSKGTLNNVRTSFKKRKWTERNFSSTTPTSFKIRTKYLNWMPHPFKEVIIHAFFILKHAHKSATPTGKIKQSTTINSICLLNLTGLYQCKEGVWRMHIQGKVAISDQPHTFSLVDKSQITYLYSK